MNPHRFLLLGAAVVLATACNRDIGGVVTPTVPLAQVRFVNALPDTTALDFKMVDFLENSPSFGNLKFRDNFPYRPMAAGSRHLRVFLNGTSQATASTVILDTTFNFVADEKYTIVLTGFTRTGQTPKYQAYILQDAEPPTVDTTKIAVRVYNLGAGLGSVDAYYRKRGTALPGTPLAAGVAYLGTSPFLTIPVGAKTDTMMIAAYAAGNTTTAFFDLITQRGDTGAWRLKPDNTREYTINPSAGTMVGGSVLTAIIVPASVAGTGAPQVAPKDVAPYTAPAAIFIVDRRPPNPAG